MHHTLECPSPAALQPTLASSGDTERPLPLPLPLRLALVSWVLVMAGLRLTTAVGAGWADGQVRGRQCAVRLRLDGTAGAKLPRQCLGHAALRA